MSEVRRTIMAEAPADRLEVAIGMLEAILGQSDHESLFWASRYGLSRKEAVIAATLNHADGRTVTKEALYDALLAAGSQAEAVAHVNVLISKIRAKGLEIETVWGRGLRMTKIEIPPPPKSLPPAEKSSRTDRPVGRWRPEEDAELRRMKDNGSELWAIAQELGRSERSCAERWKALRK